MRYNQDFTTNVVDVLAARLANVQHAGPGRWTATCPAHGSGRNKALAIRMDGDRVLLHCFAGCTADAVLDALDLTWRDVYRGKGDERPWLGPTPPKPTPRSPDEPKMATWERWWAGARDNHPLLVAYLKARGLSIKPPPTLRLAVWGGQPVMLARVEGPDGELRGLHLTWLEADGKGRKDKKLTAGAKITGAAIRLYQHLPDTPLFLTEGVETALAIYQVTGKPTWAAISAGGMAGVGLPPEVGAVVICADNDRAGLEGAQTLAHRLVFEGRKVWTAIPLRPGDDWLDALNRGVQHVA